MKWTEWEKYYLSIVQMLGLNIDEDDQSSRLLMNLLDTYFSKFTQQNVSERLKEILSNPILIWGAGPSIEEIEIQRLMLIKQRNFSLIAIDGTVTLFKQNNIIPDLIFSDLDGNLSAINWAINNGAVLVIHAHGDNRTQIKTFFNQYYTPKEDDLVWGSSQNLSNDILFNFGGFTDGDRAILYAFHFQSKVIGLVGFDFGQTIGKFSTLHSPIIKDLDRKQIKFNIAKNLISKTYIHHYGERYNLIQGGENIPGFKNVTSEEFIQSCNRANKRP